MRKWRNKTLAWTARLSSSLGDGFVKALDEFRKDDCLRHSAATSYFAILSFLPFVILVLAALGFFLNTLGSQYETRGEFLDKILETSHAIVPFLSRDIISERVRELIAARQAFGIVGGVVLVMTSSLVFGSLEAALNRIFDVEKSRNVVTSKLLFLGFVGALGVFMVISHYVITFVDSFVVAAGGRRVMEYVDATWISGMMVAYLGVVLVFSVLVRYFCPVRIKILHLLGGATLFFFLWEVAKQGFYLYLKYIARFSALYGSLSTLMVFVIWIFYTVNIFLLCAEFVKVLNRDGFWEQHPLPLLVNGEEDEDSTGTKSKPPLDSRP